MEYAIRRSDDYLAHYGIKGQKHGQRRFQNEDGSLTPEGRERYGVLNERWEAKQKYKAGTITKDQYREAKRSKTIIGKIDNAMGLGLSRRMREFENRHKQGIIAATGALGIAGTLTVGALTGGAVPAIAAAGQAAVGAVLGTGIRVGITNPLMLKYGYNQSFKQTRDEFKGKKG